LAGKPPKELAQARTVLEYLLWREDHTYEEMAARFEQVALGLGERATITPRHLRRLASGERTGTTPVTRRVFQSMFGQPIDLLLAPWTGQNDPAASESPSTPVTDLNDTEVLEMAAQRARRFALGTTASNLTGESMDQLHDDVAMLAVTYQQRPLSVFLGQLVETQDSLFTLLEGRQPPAYTRRLLLLAGVTGGLLAKVSHDLAEPHAALMQSRTAFLCADNADHNGMRAWIRGVQSLVAYWAGRYQDSLRYAQQGAQYAPRNTTGVWLPVSEARAWAALGNAPAARAAIQRAEDAREQVQPDEVDELGGLCTFSRTRELYYAAEALAWLPSQAAAAEQYAQQAVDAYTDTDAPDWGFGDAAGAATDLAIARVWLGEIEGAGEALQPVLSLPAEQRINGIVLSVNQVHTALSKAPSTAAKQLQEQIEVFTATPVGAIPRQR
jgi:hypothetical protein